MTNKYAEGYPAKRYYGGCEYVDIPESLAIERCKKLFGAEAVNVQPHSGTQANMAVYFAACSPGDTGSGDESVARRPICRTAARRIFPASSIKSFLTASTEIPKLLIMTNWPKSPEKINPK